jgi:hypothetical protein
MDFDLQAGNVLRLIDRVFAGGRDVVTRDDVVRAAMRADVGNLGFRAIRNLPPGFYTRDELKDALTIAIFHDR